MKCAVGILCLIDWLIVHLWIDPIWPNRAAVQTKNIHKSNSCEPRDSQMETTNPMAESVLPKRRAQPWCSVIWATTVGSSPPNDARGKHVTDRTLWCRIPIIYFFSVQRQWTHTSSKSISKISLYDENDNIGSQRIDDRPLLLTFRYQLLTLVCIKYSMTRESLLLVGEITLRTGASRMQDILVSITLIG